MNLGTVAVVGGGINGLCIAWELAQRGWQVSVFERGRCLQQTSSASTKLLHGGLRYIEQGHLGLVAESLHERARWMREVPQHCHWLPLLLPVYRGQQRPSWQCRLGLGLYDGLALGRLPGFAEWLPAQRVRDLHPQLLTEGLRGAWRFWDGQMDEQALGQWVLDQARCDGVTIHEHCSVRRVGVDGALHLDCSGIASDLRFDWLVNACGPWAGQLLERSAIAVDVQLDLVRGSHLLIPPPEGVDLPDQGLFVEVPGSRRIAFLLPYQNELLVGTTEELQQLSDPIEASQVERDFLIQLVERYVPQWQQNAQRRGRWIAGLRPIVRSCGNVSRSSRDAAIRRHGQVISVFGGKWTTARSLAARLAGQSPFNGQS